MGPMAPPKTQSQPIIVSSGVYNKNVIRRPAACGHYKTPLSKRSTKRSVGVSEWTKRAGLGGWGCRTMGGVGRGGFGARGPDA